MNNDIELENSAIIKKADSAAIFQKIEENSDE